MDVQARTGPVASGIVPEGAGGVLGFEDYGGIAGGSDYYHAYQTSMLARFAPDTLAQSVRRSWDEPWLEAITPAKPRAVSMVGSDVFGPPSFHSTVRNSLTDLRGEAAFGKITGAIPEGASEVSWAAFADPNGPASAGLACGTCNAAFRLRSPVSRPPPVGSYGNPAAAPRPYHTVWNKVKSAFLF